MSVAVPGTVAGCDVQVIPDGAPGHASVTFPVKPLLELRLKVKLAEPSTAIVAELADVVAVMVPTVNAADFEAGVLSLHRTLW